MLINERAHFCLKPFQYRQNIGVVRIQNHSRYAAEARGQSIEHGSNVLIIDLIGLPKSIIHYSLDLSQSARYYPQSAINGLFEFPLVVYKRPCQQIQNIPAHLCGDLAHAHGRIGHNPDQISGCLLPILSSKYREYVCYCLGKIPLNRYDLGAHIKHSYQMLLDPLLVLIQVFIYSTQQIGGQGDPYACHCSCLLS